MPSEQKASFGQMRTRDSQLSTKLLSFVACPMHAPPMNTPPCLEIIFSFMMTRDATVWSQAPPEKYYVHSPSDEFNNKSPKKNYPLRCTLQAWGQIIAFPRETVVSKCPRAVPKTEPINLGIRDRCRILKSHTERQNPRPV